MRIIPISGQGNRAEVDQLRFQVSVFNERLGAAAVRIYDRQNRRDVSTWCGESGRRVLDTSVLPAEMRGGGRFLADKSFVWHLMLAAASVTADINDAPSPLLRDRLSELGVQLRPDARRLARMLFDYPGQHLSGDDVQCVFSLRWPNCGGCVSQLLEELCDLGVVQRISVDADNVFYDVDTRPHLHVFNSRTRQLHDAPAHGVVSAR